MLPYIVLSMSASVGCGVCFRSADGLHDLAGLTIAALRHIQRAPSLLKRVIALRRPGLRWW